MASIEEFLSGNKTYSSDYIRAYKNRYERLTKQQEEVRKQIEEAKKQEEEREAAYKKARTEYGADELNKRIEAEQEVWNGGTRVYNTKTNSYERPIVVLNDDNSIAYTNLDNIDRSKTVTSPMTGGVPYLSQALTGLANITSGGLIKNISDNDVKNKYAEQVSAKVNEIQANKDELIKNLGKDRYNQLLQEANTYAKGSLGGYAQDVKLGSLSVQRNRAWDQYYKDGTYVSKQKAEELDRQLEEYQENNLSIGKQMFSTTVNQIPQFTYQIKKNVGGAVLSAAAYGLAKKLGAPDDLAKAVAAKTYGTSAVISGFGVTMEQTRGGEYGDLIRLGVPEDIARDAVQSSAVIQSIIEEAEEIVDIRNAFKVPQKDSVANGLKQVFKNWGVNIVTEGLQEGTQSVVGFVYEKDALNRAGMDVSDYTLESMMSQAWEEAKGGAEVGATMYIADGLPHIVVSAVTNARNQRLAIQDAPLISAQINIPTVEDDFGNVTVKSIEDAKKTIEEAYDEQVEMLEAQKRTAPQRDIATIDKAIEITKEGKEKATTDKAVKALVDETNKVLDTQAVNKKQTLSKTIQDYADKVLGEEQEKAREKGFKDMTFKVADDITTGQKNVAKFAKSFAKLNIVYYDTENYRNGDSVYKHRGFWKDGDTIFVNSRIRTTKNVLSVVGHEYAHVYIDGVEGSREPGGLLDRMYTNEEAIAYGRNHGWRKQGFMPQQEIISYKEEMFADDVGEFLSNPVTVNNIEQGNKSVTASIKNTVANIVENSIGYRPQFDNVSQYNLEGQSVLGGVELNDDAKGRILQDINERSGNVSKKETTQEKSTPKLSKKENTATKLTPEQKSNESWYRDQREDNKSRDAIQKSLALRMNKGVNSPEVKVELDRLEKKYNEANRVKRSAHIARIKKNGSSKWYENKIGYFAPGKNGYQEWKLLDLSEYKDQIENSMSMSNAREMIQRAYANKVADHSPETNGKTRQGWLRYYEEHVIANAILEDDLLKEKFLKRLENVADIRALTEGVILAYKAKALKGSDVLDTYDKSTKPAEPVPEANFSDKYGPTNKKEDARQLIADANSGTTWGEKARWEFVANVHDKKWLKDSGVSYEEAYKLANDWADLSKSTINQIERLNAGVAFENKWTGIENSNILKKGTFEVDDLKKLGLTFRGKTPSSDQVQYIINTILAIDTHQQWYGLKFTFDASSYNGRTGGEYDNRTDEIYIYVDADETVSHEMGHRLDYAWNKELVEKFAPGLPGYFSSRLTQRTLNKIMPTKSLVDFANHFYAFMNDIGKNADLRTVYTKSEAEVFARFFAKFVYWVSKKADNNIMYTDFGHYEDKFSERQFKEFVKILQEKSALDAELYFSKAYKDFESFQNSVQNIGSDEVYVFFENIVKTYKDYASQDSKETFFEYYQNNKDKANKFAQKVLNNKYYQFLFEKIEGALKNHDVSELDGYGTKYEVFLITQNSGNAFSSARINTKYSSEIKNMSDKVVDYSMVREATSRLAKTIKTEKGYRIVVKKGGKLGPIEILLQKETYQGNAVDSKDKPMEKYETVKKLDVYNRSVKETDKIDGDKKDAVFASKFESMDNLMRSIDDRLNRKFSEGIKKTRTQKKQDRTEQELKTTKSTARKRGSALRWSWKKEEQQRKQKETWKARTQKREVAIRGLISKAKAKDTVRKIGKLQDELLTKMKRFEKSEAYKFMTDEQRKLYTETFGNIYRKAKSKTDKTRVLEEAKAKIANELLSDPDIVVNDRIRKLALAPTQKTLSEFETVEQMTELIDAFEKVVEDTRKQQELVGLSKNTTSKEEKENFAADVKELKDNWSKKTALRETKRNERSNTAVGRVQNALGTALNTTGRTLKKVYKNALSTIETQLLNMAGGNRNSKLMDIYNNLDRGVSRERGAYTRLNRILSSFLNDKKYAQLRKAIHPKNGWKDTGIVVKDTDGVEHKLYLNEGLMISLAMHYMQDQSLKHISGAKVDIAFDDDKNLVPITREGGGITIPNMELAKAGRTAEAISEGYIVKLSKKQLAEILDAHTDKDGNIQFGSLSNEANELVKTLKDEFFEQTYNYSDEVYYARHGYHLRRGDNYFPLVANKAYIYSHDKDRNLTASSTREAFGIEDNASFTKERNDNAFNPIVLENIGDVITRMIDGVSKYYGYEIALHNNRTLMNIKTNDINIEDALTKLDPSFKSNYRALEGFISGTMRHPKDLFSWARGKHAEFTLSLNPGSWVKQLLSVPTTAKYFTTKEMMEFVAGGEAALYETMKAYLESKGDYEKGSVLRNFVRYMTDDLDYRNLGFGLADMSDVMENKSVFQKLDIVKGVARFDMLGVNTVTRMFLFAELNRRGLLGDNLTRLSADEADAVFQAVGRDLEHFLRVTQPDYSQVNRANITRNSGVFARFATMYSTPALQMANNLMQSLSEFNYARSTGDKELMTKSGISLVKSAGGIVVASVGSVLISRAISQMFKGKDDEEDDFELGKEIAVSMLAPTLVLDDIARGLLGMQQYDSQVPELIAFDAVTSIASNINGLITGKEETKFNKVKNIIRDLGTLTGIPTRDLMKIARTVLMYGDSKLYYDIALRENTNAYKKWLDGNTTEDTRDFYKAYTATRDKVLESKYGYHKEDKANNIKSNKKESFRKALEDVFGKDSKKVDEYMTILGGYKS